MSEGPYRKSPIEINEKESRMKRRFGIMQMIFSVKMVVIMYVREPNDTMAPLYWTGTFFSYSRTVTKKLEENWNRKQQYVQVIREKMILLSLKNLLYDILLCSASCFASGSSMAPSSSLC